MKEIAVISGKGGTGKTSVVASFAAMAPGAVLAPGAAPLPEAPFGTLAMVMLSLCVVTLALSGMMAYDLMRHMWSWGEPYSVTSSLMDMILGILPG